MLPGKPASLQYCCMFGEIGQGRGWLTLLPCSTRRRFSAENWSPLTMSNAEGFSRMHFRKFWLCIYVFELLAAGTFVGCNGTSSKPAAAGGEKSETVAAAPTPTPRAAKSVDLEKPVVQIETSAGSITVQLDGVRAPGTVRNFLNYVNDGFYENTLVHYVAPGKMVVAGGYSQDKRPKPARSPIRNEAHNGVKNVKGTIAMAR